MKLSMAQMSMSREMDSNFDKTKKFIEKAAASDLLFFPEIQLTPFFPQYRSSELQQALGVRPQDFLMTMSDPRIVEIQRLAAAEHLFVSPNFFIYTAGKPYDMSLMIDADGRLQGTAKMVHILNAPGFWEQDYYTPSDEGFPVFDTPFGRIGIVICFDRHLPESIRTAALKGAELVIVPTANLASEPMDLFEWEMRVQAFQNNIFIAMCNRTGKEGDAEFCGASLVIGPSGELIAKAGRGEELVTAEIDLSEAARARKARPYITLRRPEWYR
ncbi:MAG: carbon-nitrogen hydrolase family protein [Anaerovoracaceae bacterium]|jgi:predicted amidohydrolase